MGKTKFVCFLIFLAACVLWFPVSGQSVVVDSLERVVEGSGTPNGARIEAMERLSKILGAQNKFEDDFAMLEQAQQLSYQEEDGKYGARVQSHLSNRHDQKDSLELKSE